MQIKQVLAMLVSTEWNSETCSRFAKDKQTIVFKTKYFIFTSRVARRAKVMFSQASVCPGQGGWSGPGGEGMSTPWTPSLDTTTPWAPLPRPPPPPLDTTPHSTPLSPAYILELWSMGGWYTSYWNAFSLLTRQSRLIDLLWLHVTFF